MSDREQYTANDKIYDYGTKSKNDFLEECAKLRKENDNLRAVCKKITSSKEFYVGYNLAVDEVFDVIAAALDEVKEQLLKGKDSLKKG